MKELIFLFLVSALVISSSAQKFSAEQGVISFFSDAAIEDIEAENRMVGSLFNSASGALVFIVKIRDFKFDKALMREHFNEKYMETEKFPKATFDGIVSGFKANTEGEQKVKATGKLVIHGVTRIVDFPGTLQFINGKPVLKSKFTVKLEEYDIKIPKLVWRNIAEEIEVSIDFTYKTI